MKTKKLFSFSAIASIPLLLLSTIGFACIDQHNVCKAVVPKFCYKKTVCTVVFDQHGAMTLNFGVPFNQLKSGARLKIHGKWHKIRSIDSYSPGFKLMVVNKIFKKEK